jgi:signal transduction histidine kinase
MDATSTGRGEAVASERARDLFGARSLVAYAATFMVCLLVAEAALLTWSTEAHERILAWVAVLLATQAGIGALIYAFHRRPRTDREVRGWGLGRAAAEATHGLAWSISALLLHTPGHVVSLLALMVTIVGLTSAMAAGLAVHMPSLVAFVVCAQLPAALFLVLRTPGPPELYAAAMLLTTTLFVLVNAARMSAIYDHAIGLRLDLRSERDEGRRHELAAEAARQIAERAAAERTQFFGAASHDLRQPVHALGLYLALLRTDPPKRQRLDLIASIAECIDSLDRLFNAILGVAQAARSREESRIAPVSLDEAFQRLKVQFEAEAQRRGLRLRIRSSGLWILGESAALERILSNLCANALRYTTTGGVLVGVRRRGQHIGIVVADTGVGLAEDDRQRIFEPFYQAGGAKRGRDGFGLGLATVQELCRTHGYDIQVQSRLNCGTTVEIHAPSAPAPLRRESAAAAPAAFKPIGARRRVLLVEDDRLAADALCSLLASWGVDVRQAHDRIGALAVLERGGGEPWLGLIDYRLGGPETGLDVADAIRAAYGERIKLSLLTGEADPEIFQAARRRRMLVLHKPLKPVRLRALLAAPG